MHEVIKLRAMDFWDLEVEFRVWGLGFRGLGFRMSKNEGF